MSRSKRIPLDLFEVLEEEFVNLHESPLEDESLTVELPDSRKPKAYRSVTAGLSWQFHESHIKDAVGFAATVLFYLAPKTTAMVSPPPDVHTSDWAKKNLALFLEKKFDDKTLKALLDFHQSNPTSDEVPNELLDLLTTGLNRALQDPGLYRGDRFQSSWLSAESRGLIELRSSDGNFAGDDLIRFNRLLMEDAFSESFEKIYDIRLAAIYQRLHQVQPRALCLSGGGIRSGTFSLGILQGMARHKVLDKFHYLSTVSGGGYIGSWLIAWIHRHPKGLPGVITELANSNPRNKIDPDPLPIHYLRKYSNFITPKVGLLTADTWTFFATYLRNLFLNWLVIIPLLLAVLMLPRIIVALTLARPEIGEQPYWIVSLFGYSTALYPRHIFLVLGFILGVWALAYMIFNRPGLREELQQRSPFGRAHATQRWFLVYCLLPFVGSALCLTTFWAWSSEGSRINSPALFALFGILFTFVGWSIATLMLRRVFNSENRKNINFYDLGRLLFAGLGGGILLWVMSGLHNVPGSNVVGYNNAPAFPWTSWTEWTWTAELFVCFAVPVFMLVFLLGATLFVGVSSVSTTVSDEDREWWARLGAWVLIAIIAWTASTTLVILGPIALLSAPKLLFSVGGFSGLLAVLLGRSSKTPANEASAEKTKAKAGLVGSLMSRSLPLLAVVFLAAFLAALSLGTTGILQGVSLVANQWPANRINEWLTNIPSPGFASYIDYIYGKVNAPDTLTGAKIIHMNVLHHSSIWLVLGLTVALFLFGWVLTQAINLNLFSLHAAYRSRLIRAFLGASRADYERKPNPFTGFDPADNINMHELRPDLLDEDDLIDPAGLAAELKNDKNPLSKYLASRELLSNVSSIPSTTTSSQRLIAALRTDLNGALLDEDLYRQDFVKGLGGQPNNEPKPMTEHSSAELKSDTAVEPRRGQSHILLNRAVLERAYPNMIRPPSGAHVMYRLMPVINTTLNLVGGDNLAWQQRKAEPFSVTPLHSGCYRVGYRNSREYGGMKTGGISIGTAATISGAAASSNMGYYTTSPVLSLLLTLFNVRLGWWLGNPGAAGDTTYQLRAPKYSIKPIIDEALGLTDDRNKYVYLTDGGHFENLALYEMVLRRCHFIVLCDGAQDESYKFTDLGNAIRKIRIDLGVPIEFSTVPIYASWPQAEKRGMYWAIGKIRYSCIDGPVKDGFLLYIKPAVYGSEPRDVLEYKKSFPAFPHQSTADQFFDEPQFESYRILGSHIMDQLAGSGNEELDLHDLIENALERLITSVSRKGEAEG